MNTAARFMTMVAIVLAGGCASETRRPPATAPLPDGILDALATILLAEDRREGGDALRPGLSDPHPEVRARAARAAGRIAYPGAAADLEPLLEDPAPRVRREAVFAVGLLGDPALAVAVSTRIADPDPGVRASVAAALGLLGDPSGLPTLARDADAEVLAAACRHAGNLWRESRLTPDGDVVDAVLDASRSSDDAVGFAATYALASLVASGAHSGSVGEPLRRRAQDRLVALAVHPDPEVRLRAAEGLGGVRDGTGSDALDILSEDEDFRVRAAALAALASRGSEADPQFSRALRDPSAQVVAADLGGLGRIGGNRAILLLLQSSGPGQPVWVRARALEALGAADSRTLRTVARRYLGSDEDVRLGAAALRGLVGGTDPQILGLFRAHLDGGAPAIRSAAIDGLAAARVPLEELAPVVEAAEVEIRAALARAVGRAYVAGEDRPARDAGVTMLSRIWARSVADETPAARLAVLDAAAACVTGEAACRQRLQAGLDDPRWQVRHHAARLLRDRFEIDERDRVGPAPAAAPAHYRAIVEWASVPRAAVVSVRRRGFPAGRFTVALETAEAPLAAWRFAQLAEEGAYAGLAVSRLEVNRNFETAAPPTGGTRGAGPPREPGPAPRTAGMLLLADPADGRWRLTFAGRPELDGRGTVFARVVQNLPGVALLVQPDDVLVSIRVYEGDGSEPLPPPTPR